MCKVDEKVGWAPPSYLKKCITKDADSDSEEEYLGLPESCEQWYRYVSSSHMSTCASYVTSMLL